MAQNLVTTDTQEVEGILNKSLEDFVTFTVGGQLFGIPILKVQDILSLDRIAAIPLAPPKVKGSINLRGRIVTVVSVRVCLGLSELAGNAEEEEEEEEETSGETVESAVPARKQLPMGVTIDYEHDLYTLLVDHVGDVVSVSSDFHEGNPSTLDPSWREFAHGVYRLDDRLMVVLDVERLLDVRSK